ncbi:MAG: CbtA family protein, partial [Proteobacteria bacterium]|nr:CbtA family protein [Pseudomonadota bacterium]
MLKQIFYPGLLAGVLAGLFIFGAQQMKLVPLILEAEKYESAAPKGDASGHHGTEQTQSQAAAKAAITNGATTDDTVHVHDNGDRHVHGDGNAWAPEDGFERTAFSLLSNVLTAIGFGFVLAGAMALSRRKISWREG